MQKDEAIVRKVIRRHGSVLDLKKEPGVLIDIIRQFGPDLDDGGLPGGVRPSPPPGPTSFQEGPSNTDLMREVLKLSRAVALLTKRVGP